MLAGLVVAVMSNVSRADTSCSHDVARAVVSSYSFITVACIRCTHQWTVEIARLPDNVRTQVPYVEDLRSA